MEKDIQNYSPTVIFRRTPCTLDVGPVFLRLRLEVCVKTGLADRDIRDLVGFTNVLQGNLILQSINTQQQKYKQENCRRGIYGENTILKNRSRDCVNKHCRYCDFKNDRQKISIQKIDHYFFLFLRAPKTQSISFKFIFFCLILIF